ncbi:MAG: hypothetical protein ACRD19_12205, partial [Terriglobia bacterium]
MNEHLSQRFDFLEERLHNLENVALSEEQKLTARTEPDPVKTGNKTTGSRVRSGGDRDGRSEERGEEGLLMSHEGRVSLQIDPIREFQEKLAMLVEKAVGSAEQRVRGIADEMLLRFMTDIEKALQKSAGVMASQAIRLLEDEIKITARHSLQAGLAGMKLSAAVEASNSTALLTSFDTRLHATLRAFEENTAKQLAANFQNTVRELLSRELESLRTFNGKLQEQSRKQPEMQDLIPADAAQRINTITADSTVHATVGPPSPLATPVGASGPPES